jgi:TolB protein
MSRMRILITTTILFFINCVCLAQSPTIGLFTSSIDIGSVKIKGSATYQNQLYTIKGSGENIWAKKDEFHYLHRNILGNFLVSSKLVFSNIGKDPHRKSGWMIRTSTDTTAPFVALTVHADGLTSFQYRKLPNTNIEEVKTPIMAPDIIQVERNGRSYIVSIAKIGQPFWTVEIPDFDFPEQLMVGLFVCSHNVNEVEEVKFTNVKVFNALK